METELLREILMQLKGLRRHMVHTWITFAVALAICLYLLMQESKYAYYRMQYENQKVELSTLTYRLNSLDGRIIALEQQNGQATEE